MSQARSGSTKQPRSFWAMPLALVSISLWACKHPDLDRAGPAIEPIDWENISTFARDAKFIDAKISPKGDYLAVVINDEGRRWLAFMNLATRQFSTQVRPHSRSIVGSIFWANDERVVVEMVDPDGSLVPPLCRGELYAVNADGGDGRFIAERRMASDLGEVVCARVVSALPGDGHRVLIETMSGGEMGDRVSVLYKLDVYTGARVLVAQSPIPGAQFFADENGEPRIASGLEEGVRPKYFYRDRYQDWRELSNLRGFTRHSDAIGFVARDRAIYVVEGSNGGFELDAVSIASGERRLLSKTDVVPPRSFIFDGETLALVAVEYEADLPRYHFLMPQHPLGRAVSGLLTTHRTQNVRLINMTADRKRAIFWMYSDREPGQLLLVDMEKMSAEPILQARPWIRPQEMAEMSVFHIDATDGMRIHGYLTLPPGRSNGQAPPLVVLPHGGPHFVRDFWGFNPEVQLLASNGFAVLQVNYRGSGGYGLKYQEAGYRKWGDRMVQDIIDATASVVDKGLVDAKRICIYGAGFGGYAALQSAIRAPALFRCVVSYAGIYDLSLISNLGDTAEAQLGQAFARTAVGDDLVALRGASPVYNADRIRARVLLIHGGRDRRAPFEQAERLKSLLTESGRPPEWLEEPTEGHGFYDQGARERMYSRIVGFLRENTKPEAPLAGTSRGWFACPYCGHDLGADFRRAASLSTSDRPN